MKKSKKWKFILVFVFLFSILTICKNVEANTINSISMDIYIDKEGSAIINEVWNCKTTKGTEVYHPYYNLGNSTIKDLTVSEENLKYSSLQYWSTTGTMADKSYKCGVNHVSNGVELCWGISSYGNHVYNIQYTITNFVSELIDSQMIYWTLIPKGFSNSIKDVRIKIHSDYYIPDTTDVWGYGKYGGTAYVYDGYIEFNSQSTLKSNEYMTILVKFPLGTFNTSNKIRNIFDYYHAMAEEGAVKYDDNHITSISLSVMIFSFLGVFFVLVIWRFLICNFFAIFQNNVPKKILISGIDRRIVRRAPYYREIPCDKDILRAYFIAGQYRLVKNKTDILGALLLKWIKEKKVKIEKRESKSLFRKYEVVFVLNKEGIIENSREDELFNMIYKASYDGVLEGKEFKRWCEKYNDRILSWFDNTIREYQLNLVKEGSIVVENVGNSLLFRKRNYYSTSKLTEEARQLSGLKKYIEDYTLINKREPIEVHLFEDYMIYAQMMGIAKKVSKRFKKVFPEMLEQSDFRTYENIFFVNSYIYRGISIARFSKAREESRRRARNYSFGGGGFSSGGGGRGSFGGGGSGGGFR